MTDVAWAAAAAALMRASNSARLSSGAYEFERLVAEQLGGEVLRTSSARLGAQPDIVVARGKRDPLVVEVKTLSQANASKNLRNRVVELTSAAVTARRLFPGDVAVGAVLGLVGSPQRTWADGLHDAEDPVPSRLRDAARDLLRNSTDRVGFDSVLVGLLGDSPRWLRVTAHGEEEVDLSTEAAFARLKAALAIAPAVESSSEATLGKRFLFVADEWRSSRGGLSTINRELAIALADCGCDVAVMVPAADPKDRDDASTFGVTLVSPDPVPGLAGKDLLTLPPRFPDSGFSPDYIVGHGRVLGSYAFAMQTHFPEAKRVHIVHTASDLLEAAKELPGGPSLMESGDERRNLEATLARSAHLVLGVGPYLTRWITNALRGHEAPPPVAQLDPGLRDWKGHVDPVDPPPMNQVLVVARAEDLHSKGLDIAAAAVVQAAVQLGSSPANRPTLIVRGVPTDRADEVKNELESRLHPYVDLILRPYSESEGDLRADLWQSRVVLMPSRHEGFGLSAYEAIAAGVPTLISEESGLADYLRSVLGDGVPEVLPVRGDPDDIARSWGEAVRDRLTDPGESFARAAGLRESIGAVVSWKSSAEHVLAVLASNGHEGACGAQKATSD